MSKIKISAVIYGGDWQNDLERPIESVKDWVDEVVVINIGAGENVRKVAEKHETLVYDHENLGYVEPVRNFGIEKASGDWVLILDVDEEVPEKLGKLLRKKAEKGQADYYCIPRKNMIFNKWVKHSRWWPDYNVRFFKKGAVIWKEQIHASPRTEGDGQDLEEKEENAIVHYNYESIEQYLDRLNNYTTVQARERESTQTPFRAQELMERPVHEFLSRYFAGRGYRDGLHGYSLAALQAFSELVLWLKIWEAEDFDEYDLDLDELKDVLQRLLREYQYWLYEWEIDRANPVKKLYLKTKRKLFC